MSFTEADKKKIEALYTIYGKTMYNVAYRILKDESLAEDVEQQSILKIMKCLDRIDIDNVNRTKKFLVIVARNIAIDIYNSRKSLSANTEYIEVMDFDEPEMHNLIKSPCDELIEKENSSNIMKYINELSPIYRDVITLEFIYGYTRKEIANLLNVKYDTIKKRSERAHKMLAEAMRKEEELV